MKTISLLLFLGIAQAIPIFPFFKDIRRRNLPGGEKPHIILIVADDLGWNGVGYNNPQIKTPGINSLVREGVVFEQFYAAAICAPSRFALLTGRDPWKSEGFGSENLDPAYPVGTSTKYTMLPAALKKVGYVTHLVGKWHQGFHKPEYLPLARGFDTFVGVLEGSSSHFTQHSDRWRCRGMPVFDYFENDRPATGENYDNSTILGDSRYRSRAVELIMHHDSKIPMFLYLALQFPHSPYEVSNYYSQLYSWNQSWNVYYGMVSHMDSSVHEVAHALKARGMWERSLVVFMSDNGAANTAPSDANAPLRGHKGQVLEGSIRVPAFVVGGLVPTAAKGQKRKGLLSISDWYATLAALAGAVVDDTGPYRSDSLDQWSFITGESETKRKTIVHLHPNAHWLSGSKADSACLQKPGAFAVLADKFKLTRYHGQVVGGRDCSDIPCLYDLEVDPGELNDISKEQPQVVSVLQRKANEQWFEAAYNPWFGKTFDQPAAFVTLACKTFMSHDDRFFIGPWATVGEEDFFSRTGGHCAVPA